MKTTESTIKLLKKAEGFAEHVETQGIYEDKFLGKYIWGIFHNGIGVRYYAIHKLGRTTNLHVYTNYDKVTEYIKDSIM